MDAGWRGRFAGAAAVPLLALALMASACGGSSDASTSAATTTTASPPASAVASSPSASASSAAAGAVPTRSVEAATPAGTLHGHCRGVPQKGFPAFVLESGLGGGASQMFTLEQELSRRTVVCAYDRAGVGDSAFQPPRGRSTADLVADLGAFIAAAKLQSPVFLVGHSAGANVVFMYAQAHPTGVAGFVSMNPIPPADTYLRLVHKVETKAEFRDETTFYDGSNDEGVRFHDTERMLKGTLPATLPYAVMFDEDCDGDTEFCGRILPSLTKATRLLAARGAGGRFVAAKGAGHDIFANDQDLVLQTIVDVVHDRGAR